MTLAEALKASEVREAVGRLRDASELSATVVWASDRGVTILSPLSETEETYSWIDLLPGHREMLGRADWEPVEPKNPLIQLAETLTDWVNEED